MLALFKDENNQPDYTFLDTMYYTEEPDPTKDTSTMDPYSNYRSLDPDGHALEDYDLTQLQPQNLNQDSQFSTYQPIDASDTESTKDLGGTNTQHNIEPQSDLEANEYDLDTTLHTDEELRSTMFDGYSSDEEERTSNFYLGMDDKTPNESLSTDIMNQTNSNHGTDDMIQPTKHGMEFNFQRMARIISYPSLVTYS